MVCESRGRRRYVLLFFSSLLGGRAMRSVPPVHFSLWIDGLPYYSFAIALHYIDNVFGGLTAALYCLGFNC